MVSRRRPSVMEKAEAEVRQEERQAEARAAPPQPPPPVWEAPLPLESGDSPLAFPLDVFPDGLQRFVSESCWATNLPPEFLGVPLLVAAGAMVGNSTRLSITHTYSESAALWAYVVGDPGTRKTQAMKLVIDPIEAQDDAWEDEFKEALQQWRDNKEEGNRPVLRRNLVADTTTEKLLRLLAESPRGLFMARDEIASLMTSMDQYKGGQGSDRQVYLQLWSGTSVTVDRRGEDAPLRVRRPFLAIYGNIQPDMMSKMSEGRDDGFADRFLTAWPEALPAVGENWRNVHETALQAWATCCQNLLSLPTLPNGRPRLVRFSADGRAAWGRQTQEHADEVNDPEFPRPLRGPWSKLAGYAARLALVLTMLRKVCGEPSLGDVDATSVGRAWRLVAYFKAHRQRALGGGSDQRVLDQAKVILRKLAEKKTLMSISALYSLVKSKAMFPEIASIYPALELLREMGHIAIDNKGWRPSGAGRRSSGTVSLNPFALSLISIPGIQKSRNSSGRDGQANPAAENADPTPEHGDAWEPKGGGS